MTKTIVRLGLALCLLTMLLPGCAPKEEPVPVAAPATISVAAFHQPANSLELLAGYVEEGSRPIEPEVLATLDAMLVQELQTAWEGRFYNTALARQCQEVVVRENPDERLAALKFWTQVGRCIPVDYLLVPQVFVWEEREGGEWGSEDPARVIFDLYLIDVGQGQLAGRYHFEEKQQSLAENIFNIKRFFSREGKWLTAEQLAREGIVTGLEELGL